MQEIEIYGNCTITAIIQITTKLMEICLHSISQFTEHYADIRSREPSGL